MAGKSRSPGYQPGNGWFRDDLTGHIYRASEQRKRWDGLQVAQSNWEPRHPQDFVRSRKDKITPSYPVRPDPDEFSASPTYAEALDSIPSGTNDNEL